jgi:hypothetical protein
MQQFHQDLRKLLPTLPPKVASLFASSDVNADNTDWTSLEALLKAEIQEREKAAGFSRGHRLREKKTPCSVDSPSKPARGPLKRRSTQFSDPGQPAQTDTSSSFLNLEPASNQECKASAEKQPSQADVNAATIPNSIASLEKKHSSL